MARARGAALPEGEERSVLDRIGKLPAEMKPSFLLDLERGGPNELNVAVGGHLPFRPRGRHRDPRSRRGRRRPRRRLDLGPAVVERVFLLLRSAPPGPASPRQGASPGEGQLVSLPDGLNRLVVPGVDHDAMPDLVGGALGLGLARVEDRAKRRARSAHRSAAPAVSPAAPRTPPYRPPLPGRSRGRTARGWSAPPSRRGRGCCGPKAASPRMPVRTSTTRARP